MVIPRRSLLGSVLAMALPITAGCSSLRADGKDGSEPKKVGGQRGASGVSVYNFNEKPITVSVQAVETAQSEEKVWIDETIQLTSPEMQRLGVNLPRQSDYRISVAVNDGDPEDREWTPTNELGGGLHIICRGSNRVIFAEGMNGI